MSATAPGVRRQRSRRVRTTPATIEVAGAVLLVLAIAGSALAIGAQHPSVLVAVSTIAAAAALVTGPHRGSPALWLLVGLAAFTLLQIVPLPVRWLAWLSPEAFAIWSGALSPFRDTPRWGSLSIAPAQSALEVIKWSGYGCVLLAASSWRARYGSAGLAMVLFGSALAVALVTLAHGVLDAPRIYGLFLPVDESRWTRGPLVNANPLAGYLNLGLFAGLGAWHARRDGRFERFMPLGLVVIAILIVLTGSRGGVATLLLGVLLFTLLVLRRNPLDRTRVAFAVGGLVGLAFIMAAAIRGSELWTQLADPDIQGKVRPWAWSLEMISNFPVFGAGRGGFETASQPYRLPSSGDWTVVYAHAENFPIEWISDWGIPVGLAAVFGCLFLSRQVLRGVLRGPVAAGVGVGLTVLFLQNLVDLALEMFAVSAAAWVAFAASRDDSRNSVNAPRRWSTLAPAIGVFIGIVVTLSTGAKPVQLERAEVARAYKAFVASKSRDARAMYGMLRDAMLRHPAEAYFPLIGALLARQVSSDDPLRWINRSLERAPMNGTTHLALAEVLADRGARAQALFHLRLTALYDRTLREYAYGRAVLWAPTSAELVRVFPRDAPGAELLEGLCAMAQGEARIGCFREAVARHPTSNAQHRFVIALVESAEAGAPPCSGKEAAACTDEAEQLTRKLGTADFRTADYRARIQAHRGDFKGAAQTGLDGCPANDEAVGCLFRSFEFALRASDLALAAKAADRYVVLRCGETKTCAEAHDHIGARYVRVGAWGQALEHYSAAAGAEPSTDRWIRSAEAAARAGSTAKARTSVDRVLQRGDLNAEQRERLAAVEQLLRSGR